LQQRFEPLFNQAQEFEPEGQLVWRLRRSRWGIVALSIVSESEKGSRNGKNGELELEVDAEVRVRRVIGRRKVVHIVEVGCGVRCVSFFGWLLVGL
jgi:hypothetical protein